MEYSNTAAVWKGVRQVELETREIGTPGTGEVLLRIKAAGICGTDFHILSGSHPEAEPPLVIGHEFCGEIIDLGPEVPKDAAGKRVVADSYKGCGQCSYCLSGKKQLCQVRTWEMGVNEDGGWQKYCVVPYVNLFELPEAVSYSEAGAGCLLTCPPAAVEKVGISPGDTILIIGDGPSSLVMLQLARLKGAETILIAGHRKKRLDMAAALGCDAVVNTNENDLEGWLKDLGHDPDVVIDAVGTSETFALGLRTAGREGRVHLFGLPVSPLTNLPMDMMLWKELVLTSSTGDPTYWPTALDLIAKESLSIKPLISHQFSIESAPDALEFIQSNPEEIIKAVFIMEE